MVNLIKVAQGFLVFFFGILITISTYYWVPELISVVTADGTLSDTVVGIMWISLILTWILLLFVLPGILFAQGLQEN